jgi:CRISPR-associated protein Csx10
MKPIQLLITARSPLSFGLAKTGSSVSNVESYIPGTAIRGAIAGTMLRQAQAEGQDLTQDSESDFTALFIQNRAIFHNAYPALDENLAITPEVRVVPATVLSSKEGSGFKPKKDGVFDTLIDRFCADAYGQIFDPNASGDGDRVDPFKGLYSRQGKHYTAHSATTRLLTRVGINRRRSTAEDQVLYSTRVLNESKQHKKTGKTAPMVFASQIWVEDDLEIALTDYLNAHAENLRLGGSASRGLGQVSLTVQPGTSGQPIATRLDQFNQTLGDRWQQWRIFGSQPKSEMAIQGRCFFCLDLQSDAILKENWQRTMVVSAAMLADAVGLSAEALRLHATYSSYSYRSGWNTAWGLHKDVELVTDRGAVFLFSIPQGDRPAWEIALAQLEIQGIGEARAEGFGQVRICDDLHNVLWEQPA